MNICGIIAEFNPFHNGHAWLIRKVREAGATHIAAVMSGNFVQRGEPAITEKRVRAEAALSGGADLVLELPLPYACASAQGFAFGAVSALSSLGCIETLAFGSESGNLEALQDAAAALEHPKLPALLAAAGKDGSAFARARQEAVSELAGEQTARLLSSPNNTLAIEYLRQLKHTGSAMKPFTIKRTAVSHDSGVPAEDMASASYLRKHFSLEALARYTPTASVYKAAVEEGLMPADFCKLENAVLAKLRTMDINSFKELPDLSEGLENRLAAAVRKASGLEELYFLIKTKRYPLARIRRLVLSAFLDIPKSYCRHTPPYLRILGMNRAGREILAKASPVIPMSHSAAHLDGLGGLAAGFIRLEAASTDLYTLALPKPLSCGYEYTAGSTFIKE